MSSKCLPGWGWYTHMLKYKCTAHIIFCLLLGFSLPSCWPLSPLFCSLSPCAFPQALIWQDGLASWLYLQEVYRRESPRLLLLPAWFYFPKLKRFLQKNIPFLKACLPLHPICLIKRLVESHPLNLWSVYLKMKSGTEIFQNTDSYLLLTILAGFFSPKMEAEISPRNIPQLIFPYIRL